MDEFSILGESVLRMDLLEKVKGTAVFCSDVKLPGSQSLFYLKFRSGSCFWDTRNHRLRNDLAISLDKKKYLRYKISYAKRNLRKTSHIVLLPSSINAHIVNHNVQSLLTVMHLRTDWRSRIYIHQLVKSERRMKWR